MFDPKWWIYLWVTYPCIGVEVKIEIYLKVEHKPGVKDFSHFAIFNLARYNRFLSQLRTKKIRFKKHEV